MSILTAIAPTVKTTTTVVIKGNLYDAESIPAGEFGVAAVRLTKRSMEGETYDVVLTEDGRAECDCPSYEFTYRGTAGACKHGAACLAKGLLVAPISGGSPVAEVAPVAVVRPVTEADIKRAAYFHLAIPRPAPAPVAVAPVVEPAPVAEVNPRDSWPAWTDELSYAVAGEAPSDLDLTSFASRTATVGDGAPAMASDDEAACPVTEDDHRVWKARQEARFAPTLEDDAYASGYYLQFNQGTTATAPAGWSFMRQSAFRLGQADGLLARHRREDEEREAPLVERERMENAFAEPGHGWHEAERVEAVGCLVARLV